MDPWLYMQHLNMYMPNQVYAGSHLHSRSTIWTKWALKSHTIWIIKFTFTLDRYTNQHIANKKDKYNPLIEAIKTQGWKVNSLRVLATGLTIHNGRIQENENLHALQDTIKKKKSNDKIHQIAIKYLTSRFGRLLSSTRNLPLHNFY